MASNGHKSSPTETTSTVSPNQDDRSNELARKRARDRRSQQAMRDRNKWALQNLNEQVEYLTQLLNEKSDENAGLYNRLQVVESEVDQLRDQNAALQLRLIGQAPPELAADTLSRWQVPPSNTPPTCMADTIIQNFISSGRSGEGFVPSSPGGHRAMYASQPNMCTLLDKDMRAADALSNIVGDILLSYKEIATPPKLVAAFYSIATLLKWELLLDESSWKQVPSHFRPISEQLTTPHAAWVDRIPWPQVRKYLVQHPSITLDDFAAIYSTNFNIAWPFDPLHAVVPTDAHDGSSKVVIINPVFEEYARDVRNWTVTEVFRTKFPEMAELIDADTRHA